MRRYVSCFQSLQEYPKPPLGDKQIGNAPVSNPYRNILSWFSQTSGVTSNLSFQSLQEYPKQASVFIVAGSVTVSNPYRNILSISSWAFSTFAEKVSNPYRNILSLISEVRRVPGDLVSNPYRNILSRQGQDRQCPKKESFQSLQEYPKQRPVLFKWLNFKRFPILTGIS